MASNIVPLYGKRLVIYCVHIHRNTVIDVKYQLTINDRYNYVAGRNNEREIIYPPAINAC